MHKNTTLNPPMLRKAVSKSSPWLLRWAVVCAVAVSTATTVSAEHNSNKGLGGIKVGQFLNDERRFYNTDNGLPSDAVDSVAVTADGTVLAATDKGLARLLGNEFHPLSDAAQAVTRVAPWGDGAVFQMSGSIMQYDKDGRISKLLSLPTEWDEGNELLWLGGRKSLLLGTTQGLFYADGQTVRPFEKFANLASPDTAVYATSVSTAGELAVGTSTGLYERNQQGEWNKLLPAAGNYSWAPIEVRGVAYDEKNQLWFACPQGAGVRSDGKWQLFTGVEGLPYDDFTALAVGNSGTWFGTKIGAIRYLDGVWSYRQGKRWVPADDIHDVAVAPNGDAWFATADGVGRIRRVETSLADKAKFFEEEIDKYHRRTPYEFVLSVGVDKPGDKSKVTQRDSDNDGLWTSMYGAAECFAYAATKDPKSKERANKAMLAMKFLSDITQGGEHPAPPGFPARTVLPIDGRNPNDHDNRENDLRKQKEDPLWKVLEPRWPVSADGKWYWKTDISSDELDGHYFLYGLYYDLVAETDEEKAMVQEVTARVTDHLIAHDFQMVDHDGKPTRWGRFSPKELNRDLDFSTGLRGMNSLSVLSYLKVAAHVTGDEKYQEAYMKLIDDEQYAANALVAKRQMGIGTGNQSDDEMAFMAYYGLINYEDDPNLRMHYLISMMPYWKLVEAERNPLFNYIFAACWDTIETGDYQRKTPQSCLEDALFTLKRYPLDRFRWGYKNSHRKDIQFIEGGWFEYWWKNPKGYLRTGVTLPIDEHFVEHWNKDVWNLDAGGNGTSLADGTSFLLPYYMGRYYGFIVEE
ncbi:hypothetical protein Mal52_19040 [Symmachiella dynata]|uniref:Two component regulator propeller n=1 Tax=Symmachiella dynata TaxID=2527995 RepID=A0A517ZLS4_9PLAN|nr:hypothetical protein [Symmachiella dynata]QDU43430.1 hypothetical protein Mal52_19040 [Symmachiella dynata]